MARRWVIRGIFLWLLLLCATGWLRSLWYEEALICWRHEGRNYDKVLIAGVSGDGFLTVGQGGGTTEGSVVRNGWEYRRADIAIHKQHGEWLFYGDDRSWWNPTKWWLAPHAPFCFGADGLTYSLRIPYWLPTLVCSIFLYLSWRKPRPINPATAFPVVLDHQVVKPGDD